MSASTGTLLRPSEIQARLAERWFGFVVLGGLLVALGTVGLFMVGTLTLVTVLWFGFLFIAGGVMNLWHASRAQGWRSAVLEGAIGLLYLVAGGLILLNPVLGSKTLTLALGIVILGVGLARVVIGFQHRGEAGWIWLVAGGGVGILLGLMVLAAVPEGALWILGLFVAVELLTQGWGMIVLGLALRRWRRQQSRAA